MPGLRKIWCAGLAENGMNVRRAAQQTTDLTLGTLLGLVDKQLIAMVLVKLHRDVAGKDPRKMLSRCSENQCETSVWLIGLNRWCHLKSCKVRWCWTLCDAASFNLFEGEIGPLAEVLCTSSLQNRLRMVEVLHVDPCSMPHVCCDFTLRYRWRWTHDSTGQDTAIALRSKRSKDRLWDPEGQRLYDKLLQSVPCLRWCQVPDVTIRCHPMALASHRCRCESFQAIVCGLTSNSMLGACRVHVDILLFNDF